MTETIGINRQWLRKKAGDVAGSGTAYLLIQGYPATGFGKINDGKIDLRLEPDVHGDVELEWDYYFDVRMFGELGEWHCWHTLRGDWNARFANETEWKDSDNEKYFERNYVLWGTQFIGRGDWCECLEKGRGARIWIPIFVPVGKGKPASLRIRHRVEFDKNTGLAGITDAMIVRFGIPGEYK
jgi:CRISPR-associated protein (TIGR03984 family)